MLSFIMFLHVPTIQHIYIYIYIHTHTHIICITTTNHNNHSKHNNHNDTSLRFELLLELVDQDGGVFIHYCLLYGILSMICYVMVCYVFTCTYHTAYIYIYTYKTCITTTNNNNHSNNNNNTSLRFELLLELVDQDDGVFIHYCLSYVI